MPQLVCQNLTLGYAGKMVASGLSFTVNAGDYLCIIGENGSGKSTLMKTILNLKAPMSGNIMTGGGLTPDEIGYLPQQTDAQMDFPASVREIVRSGCLNRCGLRPFYNSAEKRLAEESMKRFGIAHLAKRCFRELSGGQRQRALLARALCAARRILLLDEPASGLDPKASAEMYSLVGELNKSGTTIIMISHDIAAAAKHASHILHINRPVFFGTTEEYRRAVGL
jgi:zinc transport system ATP-binding protein